MLLGRKKKSISGYFCKFAGLKGSFSYKTMYRGRGGCGS